MSRPAPTKHAQEIRAEQVRILYQQFPSALIAIAVNSAILGFILWGQVPRFFLISWLVVMGLLTLGRYLLLQAYLRANPAPTEALSWGRRFVIGVGISGLCWGAAGAFLFPEHSYVHQVFIGFVLAGMSAGAMPYLSSFPGAYTTFLVPAVLPYAARLLVHGGDVPIAMGVMSLLFVVLMRIMSHRGHASVTESLRLRFDNLDLLNDLAMAKDRQEAINRELQAEIAERRRAEEVAHQSEQRLVLHVKKTPFAVIEWDLDFRVMAWNPAAETIFGYSKDEAYGRSALELIIPVQEREAVLQVWEKLLADKGGACNTNQNITKDEIIITCEWYNTALVDDKGNIIGVASLAQDITERKRTEAALQEREALVHAVINSLSANLAVLDKEGMIINVNQAWEGFARTGNDPLLRNAKVGKNYLDACRRVAKKSKVPERILTDIEAVLKGVSLEATIEYPHKNANGTHWFLMSITALKSAHGGAVISHIDITERKQAEERLLLAAVFENTNEGIFILDSRMKFVAVNKAFTQITGYKEGEVLGKRPNVLHPYRANAKLYRRIGAALRETGQWQGEMWSRRKHAGLYPLWLSINSVRNNAGAITHYIAVFADITQRKETEQHLSQLAYKDALTNLPNRVMLRERLRHALTQAHRHGWRVAVMFLDLDRFKLINDTLGHEIGDRLLQGVAQRLTECVREGDTVGRVGGDEFTVILEKIHGADDAAKVAQKMIHILSHPFTLSGHEIFTGTSIGISLYPDDSDTESTLLKNADTAMYRAKEQGGNRYQFFTSQMNAYSLERLWLENSLRKALQSQELQLCYQPVVAIDSGEILKFEALLRWQHPTRGWIPPVKFIPVAEETGLIIPMGEWVLREACRQNCNWRKQGLPSITAAVNLSARQFRQQSLVATVTEVLEETRLDSAYLEFELTESSLMQNPEAAVDTLKELKNLGVRIALDDFGTGYSSLSYLKRFPIDVVKIDRSFVADITTDPEDAAIAVAIIAMARSLKHEVVAEGVETAEQLNLLHAWGCDAAQGYYFSRPLHRVGFTDFFRKAAKKGA